MATLPKIVYNFNENSADPIRDYSENGNDGSATSVTIGTTTRVGKDAVMTGTGQIDMGNITYLNGASNACIHLALKMSSNTGTKRIFTKSGIIDCTFDGTLNEISFLITDALGGTVTVTTGLDTSYHDVDLLIVGTAVTLYKDGVSEDTGTLTDVLASNSNNMYLGYDGTTNSANFRLNEFKLYDAAITTDNIDAWIAEQNGISTDSGIDGDFNVGDIIGANLLGTALYAIVSYVDGTSGFRFLPLSDNIAGGQIFRRVGHLWDTARQYSLKLEDGQICFYDGVSQSSDAFAASKKTFCVTKEGIVKTSSTKTANYTITSADQRIYVDSSGGAFTITLEASPTTDREIEIIDKTGSCASFNVTVAGNGNNIIGSANYVMSTDYEGLRLIFNGTNWNLN